MNVFLYFLFQNILQAERDKFGALRDSVKTGYLIASRDKAHLIATVAMFFADIALSAGYFKVKSERKWGYFPRIWI